MPGRSMSFVLYVVVLVVSVSSVMMGLDWFATPPSRLATPSQHTAAAPGKTASPSTRAKNAETIGKASTSNFASSDAPQSTAANPQMPKRVEKAAGGETPAAPKATALKTSPGDAADNTVAMAPTGAPAQLPVQPDALGQSNVTAQPNPNAQSNAPIQASAPLCDVQACQRRYYSFRASDCTYQPYGGQRRLCEAGKPPAAANQASTALQTSDTRRQSAPCNYQACASAYYSFDPGTCTYQPYEGPRRLCEK